MRNLNLKSLLGFWYLVVLGLASAAWSQPAAGVIASKPPFAREWWLRTDGEERSGFLNGIADCLTWNAHRRGFSETPSQVMDKIDRFYKSHPESASLDVIDVLQKVTAAPDTGNYAGGQGEIWKNAHWYLNGDWWVQSSEAEQLGFVEGYLWCMRTQFPLRPIATRGQLVHTVERSKLL